MCTMIVAAQYRTGKDYLNALKERGYGVVYDAEYILERITDIPEEEVVLVQVTPRDLGLKNYPTIQDILNAAEIHGYALCPSWVGPQYRLQSSDDANVIIGMEPIVGFDGLNVFSVIQSGECLLLLAIYVEHHLEIDRPFVFVVPADKVYETDQVLAFLDI